VVELEKFDNLERRVSKLIKQFSKVTQEKDEMSGALKKKSIESQEAKSSLERIYRERHKLRSKLDALIDKLENI